MYVSRGLDQRVVDLLPRPHAPLAADVASLSGRTRVDAATLDAAGTLNIVFIGQSTNNNSVPGSYSPTHGAAVFNGSIHHRGAVFQAAAPLLASDLVLEHHGRPLADQLITAGLCDRVVIWMAAQGGSASGDWLPGGGNLGASARTGALAYRLGLTARCMHAAGLAHLPTIVDWQQGEADTDAGTSQADYTTNMAGMIAECRRTGLLYGANRRMFVHLCTRISAGASARNAIRAAQAAVVDGSTVLAGADIDTLDASHRHDGTHFSLSGAVQQAALKVTAYDGWL